MGCSERINIDQKERQNKKKYFTLLSSYYKKNDLVEIPEPKRKNTKQKKLGEK